jgi:hypothetical protein
VSGVVSGKAGGELGSGEMMVDEVAKTGGELGGGEVAGDVVGKTGEEPGRGESLACRDPLQATTQERSLSSRETLGKPQGRHSSRPRHWRACCRPCSQQGLTADAASATRRAATSSSERGPWVAKP